jgi:Cdc6-like AAA superfamily ATPase
MQPEFVQRAKADLWWRLNGLNWSKSLGLTQHKSLPGNLAEAEAAIKTRLNAAFEQRVSSSLLVVGPEGSGKNYVVESALASLQRENLQKDGDMEDGNNDDEELNVSIARVRGEVDSDHHALCYIAYQLCKRGAKDRNVVVALEDLEDHFKQCYLNGTYSVLCSSFFSCS